MESRWVTSAAVWLLHTLVLKHTSQIWLRRQVLAASTFSIFYSAAPSRSLSSVVLEDVSSLFINQHNYTALRGRSAWQFSLLCPVPLRTRVHQEVAQLCRWMLKGMSWAHISSSQCWMCKGSFVWSLTVFLPSPCPQSISKRSLQLTPGLIYTDLSDLGIIWEPYQADKLGPARAMLTL